MPDRDPHNRRFFWFAVFVVAAGAILLALAIGGLREPRLTFPLAPKVAPSATR